MYLHIWRSSSGFFSGSEDIVKHIVVHFSIHLCGKIDNVYGDIFSYTAMYYITDHQSIALIMKDTWNLGGSGCQDLACPSKLSVVLAITYTWGTVLFYWLPPEGCWPCRKWFLTPDTRDYASNFGYPSKKDQCVDLENTCTVGNATICCFKDNPEGIIAWSKYM